MHPIFVFLYVPYIITSFQSIFNLITVIVNAWQKNLICETKIDKTAKYLYFYQILNTVLFQY